VIKIPLPEFGRFPRGEVDPSVEAINLLTLENLARVEEISSIRGEVGAEVLSDFGKILIS